MLTLTLVGLRLLRLMFRVQLLTNLNFVY